MRPHLLSLTALLAAAIPAAPATAQSLAGAGFTSGSAFHSSGVSGATKASTGVRVHRGDGGNGDGRHHRRGRGDSNFGGVYVAPRDGYDLNRNWASDSYNDWWHDRPDRAFPRWMSANQDCKRQWWSGGDWRC